MVKLALRPTDGYSIRTSMNLRFETQPDKTDGFDLPILVDHEKLCPETTVDGVLVDGEEVAMDGLILETFKNVVTRMNTETLPAEHYRDCAHFVMAMNGIWLPTCRPFDPTHNADQICDEAPLSSDPVGPVSSGIPHDDRCLGFDNARFVYGHAALGTETSKGVRYLQKLGMAPAFGLSTADQLLAYWNHEVIHPILEMSVQHGDETLLWQAEAARA